MKDVFVRPLRISPQPQIPYCFRRCLELAERAFMTHERIEARSVSVGQKGDLPLVYKAALPLEAVITRERIGRPYLCGLQVLVATYSRKGQG